MGIIGCRSWKDRDRAYFTRKNNSIEHILKCRLPNGDGFCKRLVRSGYETNLKPLSLVYS
jgi:hypothetical protein